MLSPPKAQPLASPRWQLITLAALATAIVVLQADQFGLWMLREAGFGAAEFNDRLVAMWVVQCLFYACAIRLTAREMPKGALTVVLVAGFVLHLIPTFVPSNLSSDLFRYIWDGRVQHAGINPYCCIPSAPELAHLRDAAIYPFMNRVDYAPTIYPPVAQMLFYAITAVSPTPLAVKITMALCDGLSCLCMVMVLGRAGLPRTRVLIFAWNPVVLMHFAQNGHVDAAYTAWIAAAMVATTSARGWVRVVGTGIALAGATLTKFLPLVLAPAFWRRTCWTPVVFSVTVVACYACYASVGVKVFGFLGGYASEEGLNTGGGIYWVRLFSEIVTLPTWAGKVWVALSGVTLVALGLVVTLRAPRTKSIEAFGIHTVVLATALIVMLTPHYGWYYGWLALLCCLAPFASVLWLTVACVVFDVPSLDHPLVWESALFLPFVVLAARDVARQRRRA